MMEAQSRRKTLADRKGQPQEREMVGYFAYWQKPRKRNGCCRLLLRMLDRLRCAFKVVKTKEAKKICCLVGLRPLAIQQRSSNMQHVEEA